MLSLIFAALVVGGFAFQFLGQFPTSFNTARVAWGLWLVAALIWALTGRA
jgi:hypothetical protein